MTQRVGMFLPVLFLLAATTLASASPITIRPSVAERNIANASARTRFGSVTALSAATRNLLTAAPAGVFTEHASAASAATHPESVCGFADPCYSTIRAPEPQSLFLVGSGLIAMASLVRRRLVR